MEPLCLDKYHKIYSEQQEKASKKIDSITDFESTAYPDHCYRNSSGRYEHYNSDCPAHFSSFSDSLACPFEEWDMCHDQLRWIETAPFLSCYFRNPIGARSQNILDGFAGHSFIHRYR